MASVTEEGATPLSSPTTSLVLLSSSTSTDVVPTPLLSPTSNNSTKRRNSSTSSSSPSITSLSVKKTPVSEANSNKKNGRSLDDSGADQRRKRSSSVEEQQGSSPQVRVSASSPSVPPNNSSSYIKNRSSTSASHSPSHHHHLNNTPTSSSSAHGHRSPHHDTRRRSEQVRLSIIGGNGISAEIQAQAASVVADLKSFEENLLKEIGPSDQSQSSGLGFGNLDNLSLSLSMFPPIVPEDSEEGFSSSTLRSSQYSMSPRIEEGLPLPKLGHNSSDDLTRRFSTTLAALIDLPPGSRPSFIEGLPHMQATPVTPTRGLHSKGPSSVLEPSPSSTSSSTSSAPGFSSRREGVSFATVGPSTMISSDPILLPERTHSASVSEAITPVSSASTSAIPSPNRRKHQRSKSHAVFDNNIPITRDLMAGTYGRRTDNSKAANRNSTDIYQTIRHKTPKGVRIAIEEYQLGEKLGKGAFATVFKGLSLATGQFVAIKRIPKEGISKDCMNNLLTEVNLLKRFQHDNIVKYIGLINTQNHINIILEFVESGSLAQVLAGYGIFPEPLAAIYVEQLLEGLAYLHNASVVHRDVKAGNVLITKEGRVKLSDFGISVQQHSTPNSTNATLGSPFWMAPEVIEMDPATTASDIWSLGCTVIELLTGFPPYFDNPPMSAIYKMVNDPHPPFPDDISPELYDFLALCFKKNPSERASAEELLSSPWIAMYSHKLTKKKIEVAQLQGTLQRYTVLRDKKETASSAYHIEDSQEHNENENEVENSPENDPDSDTQSTSPRPESEFDGPTPQASRSLTIIPPLKLSATVASMPSSTETPNSGGTSPSSSSSSSSPTYSSASVSDRSPGPQRGSSGKKPLVKAKSEVTSSLLKFSLDLIKSDSPSSATSTQSVKGAALPRDKPLLKLEKLPPSETGDQEAGRGRRSSTSESADAITPRRTALKKKKKFNFKDLKNQFEALAFHPDYMVFITGTETRKNLLFAYTVYKIRVKLKTENWAVYRTFNDFKELHLKLEKQLPTIKLPPVPPGKFFGVLEPQFIKQRREDLQIFLDQLLKIPTVCKSELFQYFLEA